MTITTLQTPAPSGGAGRAQRASHATGEHLRDLLANARAGDQRAWNEIVRQHERLVWSVVRGFRLGPAESTDVAQNTWLRLVENLGRIQEPDRLPSWLATTARRECPHVLRRQARSGATVTYDEAPTLPDTAPAVGTALLERERDAVVRAAVAGLPERPRRLITMLMASPAPSYAEIAAATGMPVGSIGPTRQRSLDELRRRLAANPVFHDCPA